MPKQNNPLKLDPTRTATVRRRYLADMRARFKRILGRLIDLILVQDAFGLARELPSFVTRNEDWSFQSSKEQQTEFEAWLANEVASEFTGSDWWQEYVEAGYIKGFGRAFEDMKRYGIEPDPELGRVFIGSKEDFLKTSLDQRAAQEKLDLVMARAFGDLKGMTDDMQKNLKKAIIDGMIAGKHPREIARDITKQVEISRRRAETIARTEIIRAHAEGQLDSLKRQGAKKIKVQVEWLTAGDNRVCQRCADREGKFFTIEEARNQIPMHPNCRCCWIPANVGENAL